MVHWENIWTFRTRGGFAVQLDCTPEDCPDVSWADEETLEKLESGVYVNVCFRVRVLFNDTEVSADYLGNSIYENVADFRDHIGIKAKGRADGRNYGSYFTDMVRSAVSDARRELCKIPKLRCA